MDPRGGASDARNSQRPALRSNLGSLEHRRSATATPPRTLDRAQKGQFICWWCTAPRRRGSAAIPHPGHRACPCNQIQNVAEVRSRPEASPEARAANLAQSRLISSFIISRGLGGYLYFPCYKLRNYGTISAVEAVKIHDGLIKL